MSVTKDKKKSSRELRSRLAKGEKISNIQSEDSVIRKGDMVEQAGRIYDVISDIYKRKERVPSIEENDFMFFDVIDLLGREDGEKYWGYVTYLTKVQKKDQAKKIKEMENRILDKKKREGEYERNKAEEAKKRREKRELEKQKALEKLKHIRPLIDEVVEKASRKDASIMAFDYDVEYHNQYAITYTEDGKGYAITFAGIEITGWEAGFSSVPESILGFNRVLIDEVEEETYVKTIFDDNNEETIKAFQPIWDLFYNEIHKKLHDYLEIKSEEYGEGGVAQSGKWFPTHQKKVINWAEMWNGMNEWQKEHFLNDHKEQIYKEALKVGYKDDDAKQIATIKFVNTDWDKLQDEIKSIFIKHKKDSKYAEGGELKVGDAVEVRMMGDSKPGVVKGSVANGKIKVEVEYNDLLAKGKRKMTMAFPVANVYKMAEGGEVQKMFGGGNTSGARNLAIKDVDGWDDKEVADYLGIKESEVDANARVNAIDKRTDYYMSIGNPEEFAEGGDINFHKKVKELDAFHSENGTTTDAQDIYDELVVKYGEENKVEISKAIEMFYSVNVEQYSRGGRPSPSASATLFKVGDQKIGNDGNWWEIKKDVRGVQSWKKIQSWQVKQPKPVAPPVQAPAPVVAPVVEAKAELTDLQKELLSKGFINDDLTLTNKGKRVVELHKFCFPLETHPFSYVYQTFAYFYPNRAIQYVAIDKVPMYTGTLDLYEAGTHLPDTLKDLAVHNSILEQQIQLSKSNRVEFKPYSYCPGIGDGEVGVGFFVFANYVNNNELYIDSTIYNYVNKHYTITKWEADATKASLLYGYNGKNLQVVIQVKKKVVGLSNVFGLYDSQKTINAIMSKNPELATRGENVSDFQSRSKPKVKSEPKIAEEVKKEMSEEVREAIIGLELMLELADTEEEKVLYQQEIAKLKA